MTSTGKVAVQATRRDYYGLSHPCGDTLDEHGKGEWPRDSFTFRLRDEKAIRLNEDDADTAGTDGEPKKTPVARAPAKAPKRGAKGSTSQAAEPSSAADTLKPASLGSATDDPKTAAAKLPAVVSPAAQE